MVKGKEIDGMERKGRERKEGRRPSRIRVDGLKIASKALTITRIKTQLIVPCIIFRLK